MKLVSFSFSKNKSYGILENNSVICLPTLAKRLNTHLPPNLEEFICKGTRISRIERIVQNATESILRKAKMPLNKVRLLAPVVDPPKIICLGLNYKDHAEEQGVFPPNEPVIFMKPHTTIIGPNENIVKPKFVEMLDYEAELAIVIGKEAKRVSISDSRSRIFGYTILNDVSARDIQFRNGQWTRGKSFDTFAPIGPCITTTEQLENPTNLQVCTWINKELRQNSNTGNMVFNVFKIVHHLSSVMTLKPCDIIATGTPAGVGFAMKPEAVFLKDRDFIEMYVEGIGVLSNTVVDEKATN